MQNNYSNEDYAGFWVRLAAYAIDSVIIGAVLLIFRLIMAGVMWIFSGTWLGGNILFHYTLKDIVLYLVKIFYFVLLTYYTGTTCGKKLLNLRVVPVNREEKLSFIDVLFRESVGRFLSGLILWIGYIMIALDKEKRGLHDILCDTRVVYEKKIKAYVPPQPVRPQPIPPQSVQTQPMPVAPQPGQPQPMPMSQMPAAPQSGQSQPMPMSQQPEKSQPEPLQEESQFVTTQSEPLREEAQNNIPKQIEPPPVFRQAPPAGGYHYVRTGSEPMNNSGDVNAADDKNEQ